MDYFALAGQLARFAVLAGRFFAHPGLGSHALTHVFCYRSPVVASVKCYQKLEVYDGRENQFTYKKGIA
jgi:hypothetical protein